MILIFVLFVSIAGKLDYGGVCGNTECAKGLQDAKIPQVRGDNDEV